ncbi:oxygenase MpaB family protein [Mucilaginibacter sp.]|uniref:oxygenase MpaB family protein n=1 Tax=Mucilaginibacter sp. TaxID=1882438 RepID=UPI00261F2365|nr:oxygenase MpaB family protein [Mucilaginibacter sp.]
MKYFVNEGSIVRKIWSKADTALFIFAGAAAEFALNKAVDWLYFTGRLPADPLGRLFSTVTYARQIIFANEEAALASIDKITAIHKGVEQNRGAQIPDWAYRDVLFLLIDYSVRSFELLDRKLTDAEKAEVFDVFYRVGERMQLTGLPVNFSGWQQMRAEHLQQNLAYSKFTADLYHQYKKHLGQLRYTLLLQVQLLLVPTRVSGLLSLGNTPWLTPVLNVYKFLRRLKAESFLRNALLPTKYKMQIQELDRS